MIGRDDRARSPAQGAAAPTLVPPAVTRVLGGRYEVRGVLGRGGMGEVWLARDLKLQVEVALKALARIPKGERQRLVEAIDRLKTDPLAGGTLKGEFSGLRRLRIGRYRIVCEVGHGALLILAVRIAHLSAAYR